MDELGLLIRKIKECMPDLEIRENELMKAHCSFRIGGPVRAMAFPASFGETAELCGTLRDGGVKPLVVGNGTNLLVTDEPLRRFVIKTSAMRAVERRGETRVYALCGTGLAKLADVCAENSLTGMEFAHGIPGTLGGAVSINAGAYGGEMKQVLGSVAFLDENMRITEKDGHGLELGYRRSVFSDTGSVILGCELLLAPADRALIIARMRELLEKRRDSQPLDRPSAGSAFKRPETGFAAALIEESGLKGFSIGGAQVSEKHAGFIINTGSARFDDVKRLIEHIQETVLKQKGIRLEPELKIIDNE
jgi:UDP-N-acetylmuramate dehydrogenase